MTRITRSTTIARQARILELCKEEKTIEAIAKDLDVEVVTVRKYINEGALSSNPVLEQKYTKNPAASKKKKSTRQLFEKLAKLHNVRI